MAPVVGGASAGLATAASLIRGDGVVLVPTDFPSVTKADIMVTSGYKWLSSHGGAALLAVAPDLLDVLPPQPGWMGTDTPFSFDAQHMRPARGARRFEQSTIADASALGLTRSITRFNALGYAAIQDHARGLAEELVVAVEPLGCRPFRSLDDPSACAHIVALRHPTLDAATVRRRLHKEHGIVTSARLGTVRISLHVYNDPSDINALASALALIGRR